MKRSASRNHSATLPRGISIAHVKEKAESEDQSEDALQTQWRKTARGAHTRSHTNTITAI